MQCLKTYAATTTITNYLEIKPEIGRTLRSPSGWS